MVNRSSFRLQSPMKAQKRLCPNCGKSFHKNSFWKHRRDKVCIKNCAAADEPQNLNDSSNEDMSHLNADGNRFFVEQKKGLSQACPIESCDRTAPNYPALKYHCLKHHKLYITSSSKSITVANGDHLLIQCGMCKAGVKGIKQLCEHVRDRLDHWDGEGGVFTDQPYNVGTCVFESEEEFEAWKKDVESRTNELFVKNSRRDAAEWSLTRAYCARSQKTRSKDGKTSWLKIGYYCTAFLLTRHFVSGEVEAVYCLDHFGHDRMPVYKWTKQKFAEDEEEAEEEEPNPAGPSEQRYHVNLADLDDEQLVQNTEHQLEAEYGNGDSNPPEGHVRAESVDAGRVEEVVEQDVEDEQVQQQQYEESLRIKDEFRDMLSDALTVANQVPPYKLDKLQRLVQQALNFKLDVEATCDSDFDEEDEEVDGLG